MMKEMNFITRKAKRSKDDFIVLAFLFCES